MRPSGEQGRASVVSEKKQVYNQIVNNVEHEDPSCDIWSIRIIISLRHFMNS